MTEDILHVKKSAPMARNEAERPRAIGWRLPSLSRRPRNAYHPGRPSSSFGMSEPVIAQALEPQTETPPEFIGAPIDIVGGADDKNCPICLEDFSESETDGNETIQCYVCGQNYHHNCIREWCVSGTHIKCPTCRNPDICKNNDLNPDEPPSIVNIVETELAEHGHLFIIEQDDLSERAQDILINFDKYRCRGVLLYILTKYIALETRFGNNSDESKIRLDNARIFQQEVRGNLEWFTTYNIFEVSLDTQCFRDMYTLMRIIHNEYVPLPVLPQTSRWQRLISRQQRNAHKRRLKLRNFQRDIFSFGLILLKRENVSAEAVAGIHRRNGIALQLHRLHLSQSGGAKQADLLINLYKKKINELSKSLEQLLKEDEIKKDEMKGGTNNIVSRTVNMDTKYVNNRRGPFSS